MLLAQWLLSSDAAFAAGIVTFVLLLAVDLLSAPACSASAEDLPGGEASRPGAKIAPTR